MSLWYGNQATVEIGDPVDDVSTDESLSSQFSGVSESVDISAEVKEVTFGGGEASVDVLNVFGTQLREESRPDLRTAEFTMTFEDVGLLENFFGDVQAVSSNYYRITGAEKTGNREDKCIFFKLTNGTDEVCVMMNNAWFTTSGEISLAADGSAELTMEASCLIKDFHAEDNITGAW